MTKKRVRKNKPSITQKKHTSPPIAKPLLEILEAHPQKEKPEAEERSKNTGTWFSKRLYIIYGIVWVYFLVKVFIVDVEAWLIDLIGMEHYNLFLGLRIFFLPCLIAVFTSLRGYKVVLRHIFHFLTVPFYFTIYLFLKSVYNNLLGYTKQRKNATFLVFFLEILGRFLSRFNYYLFSILGVSTLLICTFYPSDKPIQYCAFLISLVLVVAIIYEGVLKVIQPLKIFGFFKIDDIISFSSKKHSIFPKSDVSEKKTRVDTIREVLFAYILITVLQKNISELRERKSFLIVSFVDFFIFVLTIATYFTFLNYSLFLIEPDNFAGPTTPKFSDFAYYSFYAIPGESTSIEPVSKASRLIKVIATCYGYYLFIFLATILIGVFSEKFAGYKRTKS